MKPLFQLFYMLLATVILANCSNLKDEKAVFRNQLQDYHVSKEIPLTPKGKFPVNYLLAKQMANEMKLDSLELGFDSLQIRIWCQYSFVSKQQLIILKYSNSQWDAEFLTLEVEQLFNLFRNNILKIQKVRKQPRNGWENFSRNLLSTGITILPDSKNIPGYKDLVFADGDTYCVEIATTKVYRFYSHWSPEMLKSQYPVAAKMNQILTSLEDEFGFKRLSIVNKNGQ